ncbi:MAG TPA: hypothetical protein VKJ65_03705, partial [Phycisphaerae bacterium]|nr:hypothetical protein [Phycisphaerae bacterium]
MRSLEKFKRLNGRGVALSILPAAIVFLMVWAGPVQAKSLTGTFSGSATLKPTSTPGIFVQNFTGKGVDKTYGSFTAQAQSTIDMTRAPFVTMSNGVLTEVFADGTLKGTSSGTGTEGGNRTTAFTIDFVITDGTGIFAGDNGESLLTEIIINTGDASEEITDGYYTGSVSPFNNSPAAVPEPSSLMAML